MAKMKTAEESKNERTIRKIIDILTDEKLMIETKLNVLRKFKLTLNRNVPTLETKLINDWDVESFLDVISLATNEENLIDGFQVEYFSFLLNVARYRSELHEKIRLELLRILKMEITSDSMVNDLWSFLENQSLIWLDVIQEILPRSKLFFEEKILEWVTKVTESNISLEDLNIKYYARLSVHSRDIFQMIMTILNEFVNLTKGNEKVLILVSDFASLVSLTCDECGKEFFMLYPRSLRHIVSLLLITPAMYSMASEKVGESFHYEEVVFELLLKAFLNNENDVLQLLTHFPQWLEEFVLYKSITTVLDG